MVEKQKIHLSENVENNVIHTMIHPVRGMQVMLDRDLALLYRVETKVLNQAVKRNIERFPETFRFQLSQCEIEGLRSQIVTSKGRGGWRRMVILKNMPVACLFRISPKVNFSVIFQ